MGGTSAVVMLRLSGRYHGGQVIVRSEICIMLIWDLGQWSTVVLILFSLNFINVFLFNILWYQGGHNTPKITTAHKLLANFLSKFRKLFFVLKM